MNHTIVATAANAQFDDFLYATIGEEGHGMLLSVLSALARVNVDPWEEADRLARLPRTVAARTLATLLDKLPVGLSDRPDSTALATRLIALLPTRVASGSRPPVTGVAPDAGISLQPITVYIFICLIFTLFLMLSRWLAMPPARAQGPAATAAQPGSNAIPAPALTPTPNSTVASGPAPATPSGR